MGDTYQGPYYFHADYWKYSSNGRTPRPGTQIDAFDLADEKVVPANKDGFNNQQILNLIDESQWPLELKPFNEG